MATFNDVAQGLQMLLEEQGTPRNVREKVTGMLTTIKAEGDAHLKADKLLMELDDLQSDVNIPSYVRTMLMSISGMLEDIEE
jgi:uncharacterized protein (UPF0147 family)